MRKFQNEVLAQKLDVDNAPRIVFQVKVGSAVARMVLAHALSHIPHRTL